MKRMCCSHFLSSDVLSKLTPWAKVSKHGKHDQWGDIVTFRSTSQKDRAHEPTSDDAAIPKPIVCVVCDSVIGGDEDVYFMLDNTFCSEKCRESWEKNVSPYSKTVATFSDRRWTTD